ncbi:MAG: 4-hydroxy-3-methylbut-2-enyl diphosphate reductase [Eubacteriales bacterium]|nr:4-hydroxy-3-methylbut-2-enyl diphosphate reductase [Eubacteriales bacterium]
MKITVGQYAGFCFGVKRAYDLAIQSVSKAKKLKKNIYTFGPLIHNERVIDSLKKQQIEIIIDEKELLQIKNSIIIVRSHGIKKELYNNIKLGNNEIIDATCPFVKKIHSLVSEKSNNNELIVIVGNINHPEVIGIVSYSNSHIVVISNEREVELIDNLLLDNNINTINIFAQTTFETIKYEKIIEKINNKYHNIKINSYNTICASTKERQDEVLSLAKKNDIMLIIGSKQSSNTMNLYKTASLVSDKVYFIEKKEDVNNIHFNINDKIGVSAGASAPCDLIREIMDYAKSRF